ncbi:hypothetical protein L7F22_042372 [Adiantum nelumboides]|nr:hypothetical protein [Adiantum nelumboides]
MVRETIERGFSSLPLYLEHYEKELADRPFSTVSTEKCKPKKCRQECKKSCPVVRMGRLCIEVTPTAKIAFISEPLCIGCGICTKKCPFEAINIIKLPTNLEAETTHRYSANSFKLHRLPTPRVGQVLGLVGTNGIGKSTALKILAGKQKPNLGRYDVRPAGLARDSQILPRLRAPKFLYEGSRGRHQGPDQTAICRPYPRAIKGSATVSDMLDGKLERANKAEIVSVLDLKEVLQRDVKQLSGGELQRFAIGMSCVQTANVYMFDEPSSYLDVKQRLNAARMIRSLLDEKTYVIAVEHDLSVLDYLSDFICCLYGVPSVYGVVTVPSPVRDGINIFLDGYIPAENMRFREDSLTFKIAETAEEEVQDRLRTFEYPAMTKTLGNFKLDIEPGSVSDSEIIVFLGENGTGKTT